MSGREIIVDFFLWFKRKHYRDILLGGYPAVQVYKNLFGMKYILALNPKPPEHLNCRCVLHFDLKGCLHLKTYNKDWPDGGSIEVCGDCGMSRYHWEQGQSDWIMIEDIPKARKELEEGLERLRKR